ncbi:MAG: succinylglutamate desuccinylase, partial [Saprospiraceae bacterium]|nr:succinylglutamate desuccinylase [Saprospiraceae bacterium]
MDRIIGEFSGNEEGPLVIIFGGMHGNEHAGIHAVELLFQLLEIEPYANPSFSFKGKVIGLIGNLQAVKQKVRFIKKDLNRSFTPENLERVLQAPSDELEAEDLE